MINDNQQTNYNKEKYVMYEGKLNSQERFKTCNLY
jgi:hypothetical protein